MYCRCANRLTRLRAKHAGLLQEASARSKSLVCNAAFHRKFTSKPVSRLTFQRVVYSSTISRPSHPPPLRKSQKVQSACGQYRPSWGRRSLVVEEAPQALQPAKAALARSAEMPQIHFVADGDPKTLRTLNLMHRHASVGVMSPEKAKICPSYHGQQVK